MPYNTAPIPPRKEATGTTQLPRKVPRSSHHGTCSYLPVSRVKKMIQVDGDIHACSNSASFIITVATEMFIQYLAEQAHNVVRSEKKPRRNIQYRDLANAVAHHDNLEFLVDIVPKTMPYKEAKKLASGAAANKKNGESSAEAGQTTLDGSGMKNTLNGTNGVEGLINTDDTTLNDDEEDEDEDPNAQLEKESRRVRLSTGSTISEGQNGDRDVEMI
ncbi:related to histone-like transcription factor [Rhynchosporium agropyri]|uniref:Related to histone-like transcription factor n=1 Tax=Rhynchosporium agropyri TaxID=914238 RepID=A0A1E1JTE8_9HELO|nr:related to histone-like transcription factor [Rhynchosporium agropyri]